MACAPHRSPFSVGGLEQIAPARHVALTIEPGTTDTAPALQDPTTPIWAGIGVIVIVLLVLAVRQLR